MKLDIKNAVKTVTNTVKDTVREAVEKVRTEKVYSKLDSIPNGRASESITEGCLVLEGGAFRGLYTQGLLDFWMQNDINFQTVIGVSAGALSAAAYMSGQIGRSARVNLGYRHNSNYIGVKALRKAHSPIRLDFLIHDYDEIEPLDMERFYDDRRRLVIVATNCLTGKPEFFEKANCSDVIQGIKASASMPFISPMVEVDGKKCLDGGCSCAVPYRWAMDEGYGKIVVVRTREHGYRKSDAKVKNTARRVYRRHQDFAKALDESAVRYNRQCDEMASLAQEGRLFMIEPSEPVTVARVEGNMEKLGALYWLGYHDAEEKLEALKDYLK